MAIAFTLTATSAQAQYGGGYGGGFGQGGSYDGWHRGPVYGGGTVYYPGQYPGRTCGYDYSCGETYVGGTVACSPKTFEGNVTATDSVLKTLAASKDFASASSFKAKVSKISAMSDAAAKATAYLKLAGINSGDNAAIVAFVGARNAKGSWITDLQRNADLSNAQAEVVAAKLQTALRGNLK